MPTTELPTVHLETVNPADLIVLDQARADATPDEQLIDSVRRHGIMQPPIVAYDPEAGGYAIVMGHRRVGAAIAAGLTTITVLVRDGDIEDDPTKLGEQIVENERRKGLTAAELAQGYKRLELFGRTPADIAAELGEKPDRVRAGLRINASAAAAQLVTDEPAIDFEQAAIIAEFDEHPKLQKQLINTATNFPQNFPRDVHAARAQREVDTRVATLKARLDDEKTVLADVTPYDSSHWWTGKGVSPGKGKPLESLGISLRDHLNCAGHAAVIHRTQPHYLDRDPEEWIFYVCTDWETNGHNPSPEPERTPEQIAADEERERERAAYNARLELIASNQTARRTWIHGHLTTGRFRPTAAHFDLMATALTLQLEQHEPAPSNIVLELLSGEPVTHRPYWAADSTDAALAELIPTTPSLRTITANAIATYENAIGTPATITYFNTLTSWGYTLTDTDHEHLNEARTALAEEEELVEGEVADDRGDQ